MSEGLFPHLVVEPFVGLRPNYWSPLVEYGDAVELRCIFLTLHFLPPALRAPMGSDAVGMRGFSSDFPCTENKKLATSLWLIFWQSWLMITRMKSVFCGNPLGIVSILFSLSIQAVEPAVKPAFELEAIAVRAHSGVTLSAIELLNGKKKVERWKLSGSCQKDLSLEVSKGVSTTCVDGLWVAEIPHQNSNALLVIQLYRLGATDTALPANTVAPSPIGSAKWILSWKPSTSETNVSHEIPEINAVTQAYLDNKPVEFIDLDASSRTKTVLRNFSPGLAQSEKAELFFSSGIENYQVSQVLEKDGYEEIPWELWGPKIEKPGVYQYRTTLWKDQRDFLGILNDLEVGRYSEKRWQLRTFELGTFFGFQSGTGGSVFSIDSHWLTRYRLTDQWSLIGEVGLLLLKEASMGLFPAAEIQSGVAYSLGRTELQAGLGWQYWKILSSPSGVTFSVGSQFTLEESISRWLLESRSLRIRYSFLGVTPNVHLLRAGLSWNF